MKNRREFLKIFGKLTVAGAALVTVGTLATVTPPVTAKPLQSRPLNDAEKTYIVKRNRELGKVPLNASARTVGKPDVYDLEPKWIPGNFEDWRKVWAKEAGRLYAAPESVREQLIDNVFKADPMISYLTSKSVQTTTIPNVDTHTNSYTTGTYINSADAGAYSKTWATFKENGE